MKGEKLTQGDSFMYLGGAECGDGKTEREVRRRAQAGTKAWRAVEWVMVDRRNSKRLKGNVMRTCVTPACLYGTKTLTITKLQQQRLQVCETRGYENNKSNKGKHEENCGVKGRDMSADKLDRETGEERTTVDRTRRKDGG